MPVAEAVQGFTFIDAKWKKSHPICPGGKDAATQVGHQRRHHDANFNWLEYRQQFNSSAPGVVTLIGFRVEWQHSSLQR